MAAARRMPKKCLTAEESRDWRERCDFMADWCGRVAGLAAGVIAALPEGATRRLAEQELGSAEAVLLNAFEVWRKR